MSERTHIDCSGGSKAVLRNGAVWGYGTSPTARLLLGVSAATAVLTALSGSGHVSAGDSRGRATLCNLATAQGECQLWRMLIL